MTKHERFQPGDLVSKMSMTISENGHVKESQFLILKYTGKVPAEASSEHIARYTYKVLVISDDTEYWGVSKRGQVITLSVPENPTRWEKSEYKVVSQAEI